MEKLEINELVNALKLLIIEECDKEDELTPEDWDNNEPLLGPESTMDLDSLDTLQISMAIQKNYGVRLEGANEVRKAMTTVVGLAGYIIAERNVNHDVSA